MRTTNDSVRALGEACVFNKWPGALSKQHVYRKWKSFSRPSLWGVIFLGTNLSKEPQYKTSVETNLHKTIHTDTK